MVLEDFNSGRIAAVSYDSREPIARTLSSFAINLNGNPTFAGIVSRRCAASGSRSCSAPAPPTSPASSTGIIVGVEKQKVAGRQRPTVDAEVLNMWCAEGLRAVKLTDVQQLQVRQPGHRERVPPRAGRAGAARTTRQKKAVSLHFAGDGKRKVQVGYVIEAPIWKTSYRLVLGEKEKPYLQGWAMVENPTDEDWTGVKMALISGRPITFKMDLYNPLYVNRPTVEPELFASLRPVTYRGGFGKDADGLGSGRAPTDEVAANRPKSAPAPMAAGGFGGSGRGAAGPALAAAVPLACGSSDEPGRYRRTRRTKPIGSSTRRMSAANSAGGSATGTVGNAATAGALGDFFQYTIDHPVSLARQKSAMLPIVGKDIEGQKVSIYNQRVQAKHPLLGPEVQEHVRRAPEPGTDHGVRGQRLRRRHPRARRAAQRGAARQLRHRPRHRSRSAGRPRHAEDHQREGREGDRHHGDEGDGGEEVPDHQPHPDRPHAADRAPEPHQPAVQAGRYRQADRGHARGLPLPDAGEGRRDQDLHREGRDATSPRPIAADQQRRRHDPLLHQPDRGEPGPEAEAAARR